MRKYTCDPGTEVSGATLYSLIQNVNNADIVPFLERFGLQTIDPSSWYSAEIFVEFLNDMAHYPNVMFNLVAIGISISEVAIMPPELENVSFAKMVQSWDMHYQANFRKGYVGRKTTIKVDDRHYKVIHDQTILPDDLEYGVLYGFAKRFLPQDVPFSVWYDEDVPHMDEGGEQTIIHVQWE